MTSYPAFKRATELALPVNPEKKTEFNVKSRGLDSQEC